MWWSVSSEMGCGVLLPVADRVTANGAGEPAGSRLRESHDGQLYPPEVDPNDLDSRKNSNSQFSITSTDLG